MSRKKRKIDISLIVNTTIIVILLIALAYITIKYSAYLTDVVSDPQKIKEITDSYGWKGVFVFIAIQLVQVVIAIIPGELVQLAGGYLYGIFAGTIISLIGILMGSLIAFYIARLLGYSIIRIFISEETIKKFSFLQDSDRLEIVTFIAFLIPGVPKDILTYLAGLTPINSISFFTIVALARLPGIFASSVIGYSAQQENYLVAGIVSAITIVPVIIGFRHRDRFLKRIHKFRRNRAEARSRSQAGLPRTPHQKASQNAEVDSKSNLDPHND